MKADAVGRWPLTALAVAMALMAVSNFMKPVAQAFQPGTDSGFVLLGQRLDGAANAIVGPLFGILLAAYAYGAWRRQRWVVPLAVGYAAYVIANLVLLVMLSPARVPGLGFMLGYAAVAIGISSGGALYLWRHRGALSTGA